MKTSFPTGQRADAAGAPFVRRAWTADGIALAYLACLVLPMTAGLRAHGAGLLPVLAVALVAVLFWHLVFSHFRHRRLTLDGLATAAVFALVAGPAVPLWQAALALSFGVVLAEQVFGGRGFNFLNPVAAGLAFLVFSFPSNGFGAAPPWLSAASLPAATFLIGTCLISWRMLCGILAVLAAAALATGEWRTVILAVSGYGLFLLVFVACDPVGSASTNAGRWINGLLVGGLLWVFASGAGPADWPVPLVQAVLLGSIFAPLIDAVVVMVNVRQRRARRG